MHLRSLHTCWADAFSGRHSSARCSSGNPSRSTMANAARCSQSYILDATSSAPVHDVVICRHSIRQAGRLHLSIYSSAGGSCGTSGLRGVCNLCLCVGAILGAAFQSCWSVEQASAPAPGPIRGLCCKFLVCYISFDQMEAALYPAGVLKAN